MKPAKQRGVTLVELMIAIAILSILASLAAPAFRALQVRNELTDNLYGFMADLHLARSEAILRERRIALCPSLDGNSCLGDFTRWAEGHIVFVDHDGNDERNGDEPVLRHYRGHPQRISIQSSSNARKTIAFRPSGRSTGYNTTVRFCARNHTEFNRAVILSNTGRARISRRETAGGTVSCD